MGYIFESEIEQIKNVVRARTIGEEESITLHRILASRVHPAIKAYFKAEVERNLQGERQLETRSKKFPYSTPEVLSLQHQEDLLLMIQYQFDQHEFETLLDQAVHFTFNFLCRPQFTLVEFLFENQRHMSVSSIEKKLNYCADYEYFSIILKRYFADHGLTEISYEGFKTLLKKIDAEVVSRHSSRELAMMTKAISGFVEAIQDETRMKGSSSTLPINAAIVFFEDKDMSEIKFRLEYERDHNKLAEVDLSQLAEIIEEVRSITSGHPVEGPKPGKETKAPQIVAQQPLKVLIERVPEQAPETFATVETTNQVIEEPAQPDTEPQVRTAPPNVPEVVSANIPDLASMLSTSERKKILKTIFHKDNDEFQTTLNALERAGSWEEASLILDDLFLARDVSPQSKVAILLTEKTYERYGSKKE